MITIVDYGLGNIKAFANIYEKLNIPFVVARTPDMLINATKIILPGVGAFDHAMTLLNNSSMRDTLEELVIKKNIPVLGICVGMQMLAKSSDEGKLPGLGWIDGEVKRFGSGREEVKSKDGGGQEDSRTGRLEKVRVGVDLNIEHSTLNFQDRMKTVRREQGGEFESSKVQKFESSEDVLDKGIGGSRCQVSGVRKQVMEIGEKVRKEKLSLPHMGWNDVVPRDGACLFRGLKHDALFYFLHSYYFNPKRDEDILSVTDYHGEFASGVRSGNVYGVQFHPEKSHQWGMQLLKNFAELGG